jgi:hypothetical protein
MGDAVERRKTLNDAEARVAAASLRVLVHKIPLDEADVGRFIGKLGTFEDF